jgi:NAD(P)H-flavin reductase
LIKYHLFHIKKSKNSGGKERKVNMYLLYGNNRIEDVIDAIKLKEYELSSEGMLEITYVCSIPPLIKWQGYQGRITSEIIQKWFNDIKVKTQELPTLPTSSEHQQQSHRQLSPTTFSHDYEDDISARSKIVVCGPTDMILNVEQTLKRELGYSKSDYILLV